MYIALTALAQQKGIVRTIERPGKPSEALAGVTINVLEYPNAIISNKGGKFSFSIEGKHQGESFTLSRVQKKGYTLVDKQMKGRRFAYSSSVPVEILMVSEQQLERDKKRIEDKAYNRAKNNYQQRLAALEKQLNEKTINAREYSEKYDELSTNYNNYIQLIDQMAERYATTDYKGLSEINRLILECIENAELERADSLINSKGSFKKREQELTEKQELIERTEQLAKQLQENYKAELQDLIQDYYNKYTIHAAAYRNDSAAYYLERIVDLSPNDVSMIEKAAGFIGTYLADNHKALSYYQLGLAKVNELHSDDCELAGSFCNNIGICYGELRDLEKAEEWHNRALELYGKMEEPDSTKIANVYLGIGHTYINLYDSYFVQGYNEVKYAHKGLEYTLKGLDILEKNPELNRKDIQTSYNNLGVVYSKMNDLEKALEYDLKALEIATTDDERALSYFNIGHLYNKLNENDKALEYFYKAHDFFQRVGGQAHPRTIYSQQGIGAVYYYRGDYEKAAEHYLEAFKGSEKYFGKDHLYTINLLLVIGKIHYLNGEKDLAEQDMQSATLSIEHAYGAETTKTAQFYSNIADSFKEIKAYDEALNYYQKAQAIYQKLGIEDDFIASIYGNSGTIYYFLGQYDKSLDSYKKFLDIEQQINGEQHLSTAWAHKAVGVAYRGLGQKKPAIEHLQQAVIIMEQAPNKNDYETYINEIKSMIEQLK